MNQGVGDRTTRTNRRRPLAVRVPAGVRLRIGPEGFWSLCAANPDLVMERTARGAVEIMAPANAGTGAHNAELSGQLYVWARADGTGKVFDSSAGFTLPNGAVRAPDASWVARDRWDALAPEQKARFAPICPDFVAEVRSPSDRPGRLRKKMREYVAQGVRLGWLLDPETGMVEVYRPGRDPEVLSRPLTLSGEEVLPGFVLDLQGILYD